ncbi:MAG: hypothetical protein HQM00_14670 [Magnetococcales bacterium]|nr:hypothetical protein [Magnetococcales bacterium]
MANATITLKAFHLAAEMFHSGQENIAGSLVADFHQAEGRILMNHGFFTEGEVSTSVPNRSTFEVDSVEPEWNEETGTYQYFSFDDGYWVDVPEEDMKTYNLDVDRLVRHIHDLAELERDSRMIITNLLWNLGMLRIRNRKVNVYLARRFTHMDAFDKIYDVLKRMSGHSPGLVLAWRLPQGRHLSLPHGHRMLSLQDAIIAEGNGYHLDLGMLRSVLTGEHEPVDDLSPLWHSIDYEIVRVNGREFIFTGKQQMAVSILVRAWQRGEAKYQTTMLLDNVGSASKAISQLFRGRTDWKELIGYGNGFCWIKA